MIGEATRYQLVAVSRETGQRVVLETNLSYDDALWLRGHIGPLLWPVHPGDASRVEPVPNGSPWTQDRKLIGTEEEKPS